MPITTKSVMERIYERLEKEMPRLKAEFPNSWFAYGEDGLLLPPQENKFELFKKCEGLGLKVGEYTIETTTDEGPFELTETEILYW